MTPKNSNLESERCLFRRLEPSDIAYLSQMEMDPEVVRQTSLRIPQTPEQVAARLQRVLDSKDTQEPFGIWLVFLKTTQELAGWGMLLPRDLKYPELGYMVPRAKWGQGLASEIAGRIVDYGFNQIGLAGVSACTDLDNPGSIRVLKKLGFEFDHVFQQEDKVLGGLCSLNLFHLLRKV